MKILCTIHTDLIPCKYRDNITDNHTNTDVFLLVKTDYEQQRQMHPHYALIQYVLINKMHKCTRTSI